MKQRTTTMLLVVLFVATLVPTARGQSQAEQTSTGFYWPTGTSELGSYAGWMSDGCSWSGNSSYSTGSYHIGVDIAASEGNAVYAITNGKVLHISKNGWGTDNIGVLIEHQLDDETSFVAVYGHVRSSVQKGDDVKGGESFATIGPYSRPHLHFGIRPGTSLVSPYGLMPCPNAGPITDTNGFVNPVEWITTKTPLGSPNRVDPIVKTRKWGELRCGWPFSSPEK
jgi:murein DD-endopeptidase MepM/ murein hydrolase activator NlpD